MRTAAAVLRDAAGTIVSVDEGPRRDTSAEALAKLRPAFHAQGTVTAGNSSQTSDGAAAVVVTSSAFARERGLTPLGALRRLSRPPASSRSSSASARCRPSAKRLKLAGLTLDQIDLVELNEAFAAQVARLPERAADRSGQAERQRRRDRARPPARLHGREADDDAAVRDEAPRIELRDRQHVCGRRHGSRRDL